MSGTSASYPAPLGAVHEFFAGWRFPAFLLFAVLFAGVGFAVMLAIPAGDTALAQFAEDFRIWCFGAQGATGAARSSFVTAFALQPILLAAITLAVWWTPLREVARRPWALLPWAIAALVLIVALALGFTASREAEAPGAEEFPAEDLRTEQLAAAFALINQEGTPTGLADLRGRVGLLTAVYSSCGYTCPMILAQTKRVLAALTPAERAGLTVMAVTLDPERDTPATLAEMAQLQKVSAPSFNLLSGEPATVNRVLDSFGFARTRNPDTGVIDHANLFLVLDRGGRIAYRFSLGERQERWLLSAIRLLLREAPPS
ncbi:MAG: SCO family protein [Deltaproteobacteria bacterium]|nr:SCO family protein [Deltaproteobacteria bacterium]